MVERKICVGEGLSLNALRSVNNQKRTLARGERTRNLIVEVNVTRGVNEIELICFSVLRFVIKLDGVGFDCYSALAFKVHVVKQLLGHVSFCNGIGQLKEPVGEGGLAVVNVSDNRKISDVFFRRCQNVSPQIYNQYILSQAKRFGKIFCAIKHGFAGGIFFFGSFVINPTVWRNLFTNR